MSQRMRWLLATATIATCFHVVIVWATPRAIMAGALWRFGSRFGTNELVHAPMSDAGAREVVRPSPDLAYSFCVLDLSRGPVRITAPASPSYLSVSLFSSVTDNYFVQNDLDVGARGFDVLVLPPDAHRPSAIPPRVTIVTSPTTKGIALIRAVVESRERFGEVDARRHEATCIPYRIPDP